MIFTINYADLQNIKGKNITCAIVWYEDIKILIPVTHLGVQKESKSVIRGMLGTEIAFIIIEFDLTTNMAIAIRKYAMELRSSLEIPKLKINDTARARIIAVGVKHILVELFGKSV